MYRLHIGAARRSTQLHWVTLSSNRIQFLYRELHAACLQGPWMLAVVEVATMIAAFLLIVPKAYTLIVAPAKFHFSYCCSLLDIALLSVGRAGVVSGAYAYRRSRQLLR